jgi:hypothetical protein
MAVLASPSQAGRWAAAGAPPATPDGVSTPYVPNRFWNAECLKKQ